MEFIRKFIFGIEKLPDKSMSKLLELAKYELYPKGHIIAKVNKMPKDFFILKSGIARAFYTDSNGKDFIRTIFTSISTTGSLSSLMNKTENKLTYDCLTDCEVYKFNFDEFIKLTKEDVNILNLYLKVLANILNLFEVKIHDLAVMSTTERYIALQNRIPDIENLIPQYHIASYLNVTPVQLSRIRKEIYSK